MAKKVIQVPVDETLLGDLDRLSKKQNISRSELIREACQQYMAGVNEEALDKEYRDGYIRIPEDTDIAEAQVKMLQHVWPEEKW